MTEDNTKDLTTDEKLNLILAELADLRQWRAKVDEFIARPDTRPLHDRTVREMIETREALLERADRTDEILRQIKSQIEVLSINSVEVQAAQRTLAGRVSDLERLSRPS
jgi:hypothetical protein